MNLKADLTRVHACEDLLGYQYREPMLLLEALQPKGSETCAMVVNEERSSRFKSGNMRLALLGDKILDAVLAEKWYRSGMARCKSSLNDEN